MAEPVAGGLPNSAECPPVVSVIAIFRNAPLDLFEETAYVEGQAWDRYRRQAAVMGEIRIREGRHTDDYSVTAPRRYFLEWLADGFQRTGANADLRRLLRRELWPDKHPRLQRLGAARRTVVLGRPTPRARRVARRSLRLTWTSGAPYRKAIR